jgi:transcriptional regulator with XRE-family HTH domain
MHACVCHPELNFYPAPVPDFGSWIRRRRFELGLSLKRAASLMGIDKSACECLELGWIPDADENFWRLLAATLEVRFADLECVIAPLAARFEAARER